MRKSIGLEALYATALVINSNQHARTRGMDCIGQCKQLLAVLIVTRKQDHAAGQRMLNTANVFCRQRGADHIEHDRSKWRYRLLLSCYLHIFSTITKATAYSASSVIETCAVRPFCSIQIFSLPLQTTSGLPLAALSVCIARHVMGMRMPIPMALENASLAAKRVARKRMPRTSTLALRLRYLAISSGPRMRSAKRSP